MSLNIEGSAAKNAYGGVDYARPSEAVTGASPSLRLDDATRDRHTGGSRYPVSESGRRVLAGSFRPTLWPTLAAALLIPLFLAAGQWQWNKAALKAERQQQLDARGMQSALAVPAMPADAETLNYRKLVARGHYEPQFQILIDNRTHNGQAGYHVVTPLHVDGSDVRLLVNRGWIPAPADRQQIPAFDTPTDPVQLNGMAIIPPVRFFTLASPGEGSGQAWQSVWQNLDLDRYRASVGFPIQPIVLQLDASSTGAGGFVREWQRPDERRFVNVGYALQWWGFATTTLVLWVVLSWRRRAPEPVNATKG